MTVDKTGLLALGLCIAVLPAAYASNTPDPLEQLRQGAEPREVSCSGDFVLLVSPGGGSACASAPTAAVLESRPTVIFDYPSQMKVGQEYSIYLNYTYSTVPR